MKENLVTSNSKYKFIKTKNQLRKIVMYTSDDCLLRQVHNDFLSFISSRFIPSKFSKGYIKGRSIYDNARVHLYNNYFIKCDIKKFFQNISHAILRDKLFYELNKKHPYQISIVECFDLVSLCTTSSNKGIPLGFITSPILSNIYLKEFDNKLYGNLKKLPLSRIRYTRYADDIIISFKYINHYENFSFFQKKIITLIRRLLNSINLELNENKTHFYDLYTTNHIKITGLNITTYNDYRTISVGRKIKNQLYYDAINFYKKYMEHKCLSDYNREQIMQELFSIKGMLAFILSIEKDTFENSYSAGMINYIHSLHYNSLKDLIDNLCVPN